MLNNIKWDYMKILIAGSKGMLGHDLTHLPQYNNHELLNFDSSNLDIRNEKIVSKLLHLHKPDVIINAAAYTDVDGCQSNYKLAYDVNAVGPKNLAKVCNEIDAKLIHISTDYVFNGENKNSYKESDKTDPINVYGKTKLEGEEFIKNNLNDHAIIRTSWLYGVNGSNFVKTMLKLAESNNEISVVNDQIGSPTYTHDLAIAIFKLLEKDFLGIFNITNSGNCSWFEFAQDIFEIAKIDVELKPVTTDEFPTPAKRPKYSVLSNEKWKNNGFKPLRHYKDALTDYMNLL